MLGWEYPPHISGGLGTACQGLTTALSKNDVEINFVVPYLFGGEKAAHMNLVDSSTGVYTQDSKTFKTYSSEQVTKITTHKVAAFLSPYWDEKQYQESLTNMFEVPGLAQGVLPKELNPKNISKGKGFERYGGDLFAEVARYTQRVVSLFQSAKNTPYDIIHAHDWMTFPAAVTLSQLTGKPLVVHVHSLEYDRSGDAVNQRIDKIEKLGTTAADAVIAVSFYTRKVICQQHGVPREKIHVVHNGVYSPQVIQSYRRRNKWQSKIVLFLGRVTFQKGPEYFVEAAAKVIPHIPDVLFIMAGSGDMLPRMIARVEELGISSNFMFTGFLRGPQVEQMFSIADLYVMPSVSEPFGISALEALNYETPVMISKQSGVAEVLGHALKVDFWDVEKMANLIISVLTHEELRADIVAMAREEVKRIHWDAAGRKTLEVYKKLQK